MARSVRSALRRVTSKGMGRLRGDPRLALLVSQGMELGEGTHIASQVYIDGNRPWLITISDHVHLAPYSAIITHDASFHSHTGQTRIGRVVIGPRAYIGVGAILLPGTSIGADSVVGAGAVVHGDVPPESLVLGNPGKVTPAKVAVAWQRVSAKKAPSWPREGWNLTTGITEERKREQREALADCADGYVPARTEPGSPFERSRAARSEG